MFALSGIELKQQNPADAEARKFTKNRVGLTARRQLPELFELLAVPYAWGAGRQANDVAIERQRCIHVRNADHSNA